MSAINFPDPSQSPWTNQSTGIMYIYDNGVRKVNGSNLVGIEVINDSSPELGGDLTWTQRYNRKW